MSRMRVSWWFTTVITAAAAAIFSYFWTSGTYQLPWLHEYCRPTRHPSLNYCCFCCCYCYWRDLYCNEMLIVLMRWGDKLLLLGSDSTLVSTLVLISASCTFTIRQQALHDTQVTKSMTNALSLCFLWLHCQSPCIIFLCINISISLCHRYRILYNRRIITRGYLTANLNTKD